MRRFGKNFNPTPRLAALTEYERNFAAEYPHFVRFFEYLEPEWFYIREKDNRVVKHFIYGNYRKDIPTINAYLAGVNSEPVPLPRRIEEATHIMTTLRPVRQRSSPEPHGFKYFIKNHPTFCCYFTVVQDVCVCEDCDDITWYEFRYGMFKFSVPLSVVAEVDRLLWEQEREPIMEVLKLLPLPIAWAVRDELVIDSGNYKELPYFREPRQWH
jgi:hypothetical protein